MFTGDIKKEKERSSRWIKNYLNRLGVEKNVVDYVVAFVQVAMGTAYDCGRLDKEKESL